MKKNVAGQKVGVQMTTAADGSPFTGAVTVSVTGDAGSQATGSVGAGACTHEGKGYHTYAPDQAETNYDLVAFTFEGTGAITATVQERPTTLEADVAAVKAKTDLIPADPADASDIAAALAAISAFIDTEVAAIKAKTDNLPADPADASDIAATLATIAGYLDTEVAAILAAVTADFAWQVGTALDGFTFAMRQSANPGLGAAGLTVTAERFNGTVFEACANAPVAIGSGAYVIDFAIADGEASGTRVALFRFSAATALDTFVTLILKPAA